MTARQLILREPLCWRYFVRPWTPGGTGAGRGSRNEMRASAAQHGSQVFNVTGQSLGAYCHGLSTTQNSQSLVAVAPAGPFNVWLVVPRIELAPVDFRTLNWLLANGGKQPAGFISSPIVLMPSQALVGRNVVLLLTSPPSCLLPFASPVFAAREPGRRDANARE